MTDVEHLADRLRMLNMRLASRIVFETANYTIVTIVTISLSVPTTHELICFFAQQSQPIEQPLKCSMFTQTEQTNSFTQTEQSNSSYGDQRQVRESTNFS